MYRAYRENAVFVCIEQKYQLHIMDSERNGVYKQENRLIIHAVSKKEAAIKDQLLNWSGRQLKEYVQTAVRKYRPLVEKYAEEQEADGKRVREITHITIRHVKTRWGSCSSRGGLNFNVKLVFASLEEVDYVIVHELCHLLYMNHQKEFWNAVGAILPDYKNARKLLRENGAGYEF